MAEVTAIGAEEPEGHAKKMQVKEGDEAGG
jgi:hypothetical protein